MLFANFLKTHQQQLQNDKQLLLLPRRQLVTYALYALIAVALLYLFVDPAAPASSSAKPSPPVAAPWVQEEDELLPPSPLNLSSPRPYNYQGDERSSTTTAPPPPPCDYSDGEWVPDPRPPPYDGAACEAIKDDGRSCAANGRADTGYLHWRWQLRRCDLPDFSPAAFLRWLGDRHMAFVGDSLARNQAESLVCLLSAWSPPELVHRDPDGRFRRWVFREHNATVSIFWSPFLVRGVEKSERAGVRYNELFLDAFDERWMSQLGAIDAAVLSAGQWFRIPSVYHDGGAVVGCYGCAAELNHTETSFFAVFRDVVGRTLAEITRRRHEKGGGGGDKTPQLVALATFSPSHFEGEWNKGAPCTKKRPYRKGEKELGYTETEMRKIVVEAADEAGAAAAPAGLRFAALDVTTLANMRPDGHPGPYMRKNPFAAGEGRPVQNDCLHWCMPGPVDTFNQILQQTILR